MSSEPVDYATVTQMDEADLLKIRLLNRTIDLHEAQQEVIRLRLADAARQMQDFSEFLGRKYGLEDARQLDLTTGAIRREG